MLIIIEGINYLSVNPVGWMLLWALLSKRVLAGKRGSPWGEK